MAATPRSTSQQYQALYRSTVQEAAAGGSLLMGKLVASARTALQAREAACRDLRERDALAQSAKQLRNWESELCKRYPKALLDAFENPEALRKAGTPPMAQVAFDELELMDEVQVLTSITLARTQQVTMLAAEASLAELNTLICSTLGLGAVNPERNPLRPQIYIHALRAVIEQTQLPATMQLDWLAAMSTALGHELRAMYLQLSAALRGQGVVAAGYAVTQTQTPVGSGVGRGVAQDVRQGQSPAGAVPYWPASGAAVAAPTGLSAKRRASSGAATGSDDTLLTLEKLRRLLSGELEVQDQLSPVEQFAQRFSMEFENGAGVEEPPATDFDATVPAALEALKEMKQVDEVVQRLEQRRGVVALPVLEGDTSIDALRANVRSHARGVAQALSLEVVTLMVDNIASDPRLLEPVQELIRRLEPPLLRLALVDPRLFTNKQHPARVLLQEVTHHSLAYASVQSVGFADFERALEQAIAPLKQATIENAEPVEQVLAHLRDQWNSLAQSNARSREEAMQVLRHAEQRNLLAEKLAQEIAAHKDASRVPQVVVDFLCGPWAQVVAQARLAGASNADTADRYQALIAAMLWSAHPDLSRKDTEKLTRLVPPLLSALREGLETIRYPATKTSAFLEALMRLHQRAFRAGQKPPKSPAPPAPSPAAVVRPHWVEDGDPWVAPEEARASNFIELADESADVQAPLATADARRPGSEAGVAAQRADTAGPAAVDELPLGSWVELMVNAQWVRTQLTWTSPHGTLFLFTSATGTAQSMTRRSRDKLLAAGQLRAVSGAPLVDGALNAVAQMAMRNSVNTSI